MYKILSLIILFLILLVTGCLYSKKGNTKNDTEVIRETLKTNQSVDKNNDSFGDFSVNESYNFLKQNINKQNVELLDVRTQEEFNKGHINGCKLINFYSEDFKEQIGKLDKDKIYFVYCRVGRRSGKTVNLMKEMGFKEAHNIVGGFVEWEEQNLPLDFSK